jgi:autotransporter-associated beta strand protein
LLGQTIVGISGTTVTLSGNANANINSSTPVNYSTGWNVIKAGIGVLQLGDNSNTFLHGTFKVDAGTLRVTSNGAFGNNTSQAFIEQGGTLEISMPNFSPLANLLQLPGSFERWSEADARGINAGAATTVNLPVGVNLELNTNLTNTVAHSGTTININGGSLSGFLRADDDAVAVYRTVGSNVTLNMVNDSFIGMATPNQAGNDIYDAGKYNNNVNPFAPNITGAILVMQGNITGAHDLTKTGTDLVILSSNGNTYNNTYVREGILEIGVADALPTGKVLNTLGSGIFDLNGFNQTVANISGGSGTITNSGTAAAGNTLTAGNSTPANATYGGQITGNLNLNKVGTSSLTLSGANTFVGETKVTQGTLVVSGSLNGTSDVDVKSGGTLAGSGLIATTTASPLTGLMGSVLIETGGSLAPSLESTLTFALGAGTLNLAPAVTPANSQSLLFAIDPIGLSSEVAVTSGTLQIGTGVLEFDDFQFSAVTTLTPGTYTLFQTNTAISGSLGANVNGLLPGGLFGTITEVGNNQIDLVIQAVPEPNALSMLAGSIGMALGLQRFRRRRRQA